MSSQISGSVFPSASEKAVVNSGRDSLHSKIELLRHRVPLTAVVLFLIYFGFYPRTIELSGDQTAAVVAAESMLKDGTYKVSLHEAYGPEVVVTIGADLRQPLRWFPPGYSFALYLLAKLGFTVAAAALFLFYFAKLIWTVSWLTAGIAYRIPYWIVTFAIAFALLLTYPSTTTEIFESIAVALVFLAASTRLTPRSSACLASASIAAGTLVRFAAIKLIGFYALLEWIRRPRYATLAKVAFIAIAPLLVYLACTRLIGGESNPYHGVGPSLHTNWLLLFKGIYYASTGGWSPTNLPLRVLILVVLLLAFIGLVRCQTSKELPPWIVLLIGFQAYYMLFLIVTQIFFGSMYADIQPAFATPRFFALTQPFNIAAILFLTPLSSGTYSGILRYVTVASLLICMIGWMAQNQRITSAMVRGPDGFFRFADVAAIHRSLHSAQPDGIFDATGVFVYTAADPRIIYPANVAGLRSPVDSHIAVVHFAGTSDILLDQLKDRITPYQVETSNRFELDFFALPEGFELSLKPRLGFVPHI